MGRPKLPENEEEAKMQKAKRLEAQVEAREKKALKRKAQNLAKKLVEKKTATSGNPQRQKNCMKKGFAGEGFSKDAHKNQPSKKLLADEKTAVEILIQQLDKEVLFVVPFPARLSDPQQLTEVQTRIAFEDHTCDLPTPAAQHHTSTKEVQTRIAVEHHTSDDLPATPHHSFTKDTKEQQEGFLQWFAQVEEEAAAENLHNDKENAAVKKKRLEESRRILRERNKDHDEDDRLWKDTAERAYVSLVKSYGCNSFVCQVCSPSAVGLQWCIKCKDCRKTFCGDCDFKLHSSSPFCHWTVHFRQAEKLNHTRKLLPIEFLSIHGAVQTKGVPVPLFTPTHCPQCEGVFNLNDAVFQCSRLKSCSFRRPAQFEDYISSGFFPGTPKSSSFLFSTKLLRMWHHLSLLTPGTSERQFAATISSTPDGVGLSEIINSLMFKRASKACSYVHHLIEKRVKVLRKDLCRACISKLTGEPEPLSLHPDGNHKLCRQHRENQKKGQSWYKDEVITSQAELNSVKEAVATVRPQGKNTIGFK